MLQFMAKDTIGLHRTQEEYTNFTSRYVYGSSMIQRAEIKELHFVFKKCWIFRLAMVYS